MGIFNLETYSPGASFLTPEQRQQAQSMGWLNAASTLAAASASRPRAEQPTIMQLLTGGVQGYAQGANQYQELLADQYKKMSTMKRDQDMNAYIANNGDAIRQQYGIPEGMPISPEVLADIAQKSGVRNAENQSDFIYKPQIAGATKSAEMPFVMAVDNNRISREGAKDKDVNTHKIGLQDFYDRKKPREMSPGSTLVVPDEQDPMTFTPVFTAPKPALDTKPLPATVSNKQTELLGDLGIASGVQKDLELLVSKIDEGKLDLGMRKNAVNATQNLFGLSDDKSRNYETFKTSLEKMRNDSLRLNKGVQTEGDAQRAWNEIISHPNDNENVKAQLNKIIGYNKRAAEFKKDMIDQIRSDYGRESLDFSKYENVESAFGGDQQDPMGIRTK